MVLYCIKRNNPTYIFMVGLGIVLNVLKLLTEYFHYLCDVVNYIINYWLMYVDSMYIRVISETMHGLLAFK